MSEPMRFEEARARLEEIVAEVRRKETTLERSVELLEEGVRLANACTERIDETYALGDPAAGVAAGASGDASEGAASAAGASSNDPAAAGEVPDAVVE